MKLMVTSDKSGCLRIWNNRKRFLREIRFPQNHPIESVCFINPLGDLLVSHANRISYISFENYWTTTFSHYAITSHSHHCFLKHLEKGLLDEDYDYFVYEPDPIIKIRISELDRTTHLLVGGEEQIGLINDISLS